jgi:light-regulated signal transduction histidine kinase (bacteriophytochrome)
VALTQASIEGQQGNSEFLFMALTEELKLPLQQILRQSELGQLQQDSRPNLQTIQTATRSTLQLLDGYLLSLRLANDPEERFAVEPVCVSEILHDTSQQLAKIAEQYDVTLNIHIKSRYEPVMAHRNALKTAFVNLGHALIEALPATGTAQMSLQLAVHRTKYGIVAGMYCDSEMLTPQAFRQAQRLYGQVRQPLVGVSPNAGTGIFVADAILQAMSSKLRVGRYQKLPGFAVTLSPSHQLALV